MKRIYFDDLLRLWLWYGIGLVFSYLVTKSLEGFIVGVLTLIASTSLLYFVWGKNE